MKLRQFLLDRPLREVVVTYIASTWGGLEISVTICELAGFPILIPQTISILILIGLILILGIRQIFRRSKPTLRPVTTWSRLTRFLVGATTFFALLPMLFAWSGTRGITWIMWQNAPIFAMIFAVLAVVMFLGVVVSLRRDTSDDA